MSINRRMLARKAGMIPGRIEVVVYAYAGRDLHTSGVPVKCERRPSNKKQARGEADADASDHEYVFFTAELERVGVEIKNEAVIYDREISPAYHVVESTRCEMLNSRIRAYCNTTVAPDVA